jgi:hypothetical protein
MKSLLAGILLIIVLGLGGFIYRNAVEHPNEPIACPVDAKVCPDGTSVAREGLSCTFPVCPPPNVTLSGINISFALPTGLSEVEVPDADSVAAYAFPQTASSTGLADIIIRHYPIAASSTALATMQQTAIGGASGVPVGTTAYSSTVLGGHRFTVVSLERYEGQIDTAYYLARSNDVLRFDAIDRGVTNWTEPDLDVSRLPAHVALEKLLSSLEGQ